MLMKREKIMIENPMVGPLTDKEEQDMMSAEEWDECPDCSWCGEKVSHPVRRGKHVINMHKSCWLEGKAEHDAEG